MQDISIALFTHAGRKPPNEDCAGVYDFRKNTAGARKLAVVADGMGGYNAGEVASRIAVDTVISAISRDVYRIKSTDELRQLIVDTITIANNAIYKKASSDPAYRGMGTTIALALVLRDKILVANVGDSRIYLIKGNGIKQLSEDHTALADAMKSKPMTEEEFENFQYKHAITRSLGEENAPQVFMDEIRLFPDSVLILCSDGLTDVIPDKDILKQVGGIPDIQGAVDNLGKRAYHQGSRDNITVLGVEIGNLKRSSEKVSSEKKIPLVRMQKTKEKNNTLSLISRILFALLILALSGIAVMYFYTKSKNPSGTVSKGQNGQVNIQPAKKPPNNIMTTEEIMKKPVSGNPGRRSKKTEAKKERTKASVANDKVKKNRKKQIERGEGKAQAVQKASGVSPETKNAFKKATPLKIKNVPKKLELQVQRTIVEKKEDKKAGEGVIKEVNKKEKKAEIDTQTKQPETKPAGATEKNEDLQKDKNQRLKDDNL